MSDFATIKHQTLNKMLEVLANVLTHNQFTQLVADINKDIADKQSANTTSTLPQGPSEVSDAA